MTIQKNRRINYVWFASKQLQRIYAFHRFFLFCLLNFVVFIIATIAYRIDFELLPFVTSHETLFLASRILTSNGNVICGKYYFIITAWPLWSSQHTNDDKQNSMFDVLVHNKKQKQKTQRKIFSFSEEKKNVTTPSISSPNGSL